MMRLLAVLIGTCLLASCGKAPEAAPSGNAAAPIVDSAGNDGNTSNAVVNAVQPKTAGAEDEDAVRAAITHVYADYATSAGPTATPHVSPDFRAALDKAEKGDEDGLGYDPWCECQDFEPTRFKYVVKGVEFAPDGDHARATLTLDLGFEDKASATVRKWIAFVRTPKGWLIDDLSNADSKSLKAQIRAMPAAPATANTAE